MKSEIINSEKWQSQVSKTGFHCENSEKWVHYKIKSVKKDFNKKTVWNEFITKSTELKAKKNCEFFTQ